MIHATRKYCFLTVHDKFFAIRINLSDAFRLVSYHHSLVNQTPFGFVIINGLTAYSDLSSTLDEQMVKFSSSCRNEVRRSTKDGVICEVLNDTGAYIAFFNDFAKEKRINGISEKSIKSYGKDKLFIFQARLGNKLLAIHSILVDLDESMALLITSSNARFADDKEKTTIGRANRHLHYFEFEYLKKLGIKTYDWGGLGSEKDILKNPGLKGVNDFKLSFGGRVVPNLVYSSWLFFFFQWFASKLDIIKSNSSLQNNK